MLLAAGLAAEVCAAPGDGKNFEQENGALNGAEDVQRDPIANNAAITSTQLYKLFQITTLKRKPVSYLSPRELFLLKNVNKETWLSLKEFHLLQFVEHLGLRNPYLLTQANMAVLWDKIKERDTLSKNANGGYQPKPLCSITLSGHSVSVEEMLRLSQCFAEKVIFYHLNRNPEIAFSLEGEAVERLKSYYWDADDDDEKNRINQINFVIKTQSVEGRYPFLVEARDVKEISYISVDKALPLLNNNSNTVERFTSIFREHITVEYAIKLGNALGGCPNLKEVNMLFTNIDQGAGKVLVEALYLNCPKLIKLTLERAKIDDEAIIEFARSSRISATASIF